MGMWSAMCCFRGQRRCENVKMVPVRHRIAERTARRSCGSPLSPFGVLKHFESADMNFVSEISELGKTSRARKRLRRDRRRMRS